MAVLTILEIGRQTVLETVEEIKELIDNSGETNEFIQVNIENSFEPLDFNKPNRIEHKTVYILKYHITMFE